MNFMYIQQYFTEGDTKPKCFSEVKTFERYTSSDTHLERPLRLSR